MSDPAPAAAPSAAESATLLPSPTAERLRIAVGSDLHLNPDNTDRSGELSQVLYSPELAEALLWDASQRGAELMLLTGDLVNGGREYRHRALTEILQRAEEDGLTVCVLPGNHDLDPIGQQEFARLYAEFGYREAYSRDTASLSYCVRYRDLMILMMDTGGYNHAVIDLPDAPRRENNTAFFSETTLRWTEALLKEAAENGLHVLCAGHYNLLPEISRNPEGIGYYVENGERFADLLRSYGVPLYLSGHMHTQAVYQEKGLTELLTEYLLGYPTGYSMLDLTQDGLRFTPCRVDVDAWAAETGQTDPVLLGFTEWQEGNLRSYSEENIRYMTERNPLNAKEKELAADFFYEAMKSFWDGSMHRRRAELEAMPGYQPFFRCAEGYAYGWWLKDLIRTASPLLGGFRLEW